MPRQSPSTSKQDYETPPEVIAACVARFGPLAVDLACETRNAKAPEALAIDKGIDSLTVPWAERFPNVTMWLNPPFKRIAPWMMKCRDEARQLGPNGKIVVLTPASVGANWFFDHVHKSALVLPLAPRITFVGATQPFPKDCMISVFTRTTVAPTWLDRVKALVSSRVLLAGFEPWRWSLASSNASEELEEPFVEEPATKTRRRRRKLEAVPELES